MKSIRRTFLLLSQCLLQSLLISVISTAQLSAAREDANAPIHSFEQLQQHLNVKSEARSPLDALSAGAKRRFLASLSFNDKGLTGFYYADLQGELAPAAMHRVLALFGQQHLRKQLGGSPMRNVMKPGGKGGIDRRALHVDDAIDIDDEDPDACDGCGIGDWDELFDDGYYYYYGPSAAKDHMEYQCIAPGTCRQKGNYICLATC